MTRLIDDLDLRISECGHPFVQTDGQLGITLDVADRVTGLLASILDAAV